MILRKYNRNRGWKRFSDAQRREIDLIWAERKKCKELHEITLSDAEACNIYLPNNETVFSQRYNTLHKRMQSIRKV